jgi:hypothetical protein
MPSCPSSSLEAKARPRAAHLASLVLCVLHQSHILIFSRHFLPPQTIAPNSRFHPPLPSRPSTVSAIAQVFRRRTSRPKAPARHRVVPLSSISPQLTPHRRSSAMFPTEFYAQRAIDRAAAARAARIAAASASPSADSTPHHTPLPLPPVDMFSDAPLPAFVGPARGGGGRKRVRRRTRCSCCLSYRRRCCCHASPSPRFKAERHEIHRIRGHFSCV